MGVGRASCELHRGQWFEEEIAQQKRRYRGKKMNFHPGVFLRVQRVSSTEYSETLHSSGCKYTCSAVVFVVNTLLVLQYQECISWLCGRRGKPSVSMSL